jgi:hypothetical protein
MMDWGLAGQWRDAGHEPIFLARHGGIFGMVRVGAAVNNIYSHAFPARWIVEVVTRYAQVVLIGGMRNDAQFRCRDLHR